MSRRDDFSATTKLKLAQRAAYHCSDPTCRRITIGPSAEAKDQVANVGVAAHICAASPGGPRFRAEMSRSERVSIQNGIWLCATHSVLVDRDVATYPESKLREWKANHEEWARQRLRERSSGFIQPDPAMEDQPRSSDRAALGVPERVSGPLFRCLSTSEPEPADLRTLRKILAVGATAEKLWAAFGLVQCLNFVDQTDEFVDAVTELSVLASSLGVLKFLLLANCKLAEFQNYQHLSALLRLAAVRQGLAAFGVAEEHASGWALDTDRIDRMGQRTDELIDGLVPAARDLDDSQAMLLALGTVARVSTRRFEVARSRFFEASTESQSAYRDRAKHAFGGWVQLARAIGDTDSLFRALYDYSIACWSFGEHELAADIAEEAIDVAATSAGEAPEWVLRDLHALKAGSYHPSLPLKPESDT